MTFVAFALAGVASVAVGDAIVGVVAVMAGRDLGFCFGGHQKQHLQNLHHYHRRRRNWNWNWSRGRPLRERAALLCSALLCSVMVNCRAIDWRYLLTYLLTIRRPHTFAITMDVRMGMD